MEFFSRDAGTARRNALAESLDGLAYYVPPELRPWLGIANELNPVVSMERAGTNALTVADPNATGWERVQALGDMTGNMAGAVAPMVAASRGAVPAAQAVEDALMGWSTAAGVPDFMADEFGGVKVWTGGVGDPIKAASDRGAWFAETPDLAKEYAGQGGRVLSAEIDPRNPIAFRHAEQRRPIGDVISTALEGAGSGADIEAARPIVERLYQRYGSEPRALFEYWNNDKDVADLFRALGYDAISAAEKSDMKAATWAALDPSIVKMDSANPSTLGFRAYHGSPHDFDRFSLDKIGTGEGAQAYGHGLYFAEAEDVAKQYRDQLSRGWKASEDYMWRGKDAASHYQDAISRGDYGKALVWEQVQLHGTRDAIRQDLLDEIAGGSNQAKAALEFLNTLPDELFAKPSGRMYEVQINADPADFLDWDKPLSEQPANVRDWFDSRGITPGFAGNQSGAELMMAERSLLGPEGTMVAMRDANVPGIKYLDHGSRFNAMDGIAPPTQTRNYVVFDDKLIEIIRKYGWAAAAPIFAASGLTVEEAQAQYEGQM